MTTETKNKIQEEIFEVTNLSQSSSSFLNVTNITIESDELEEILDELIDPKTIKAVVQGREEYKKGYWISYDKIKKIK